MNRRVHASYCLIIALVACIGYWAYFHQERLYVEHLKSISSPIMDCSEPAKAHTESDHEAGNISGNSFATTGPESMNIDYSENTGRHGN